MRKTILGLGALALVLIAMTGDVVAKKSGKRVESQAYTTVQGGTIIISGLQTGISTAQAMFYAQPRERFMAVEITDAYAPEVSAQITFADGSVVSVCSSTDAPVPIPVAGEIEVALFNGTCGTSALSGATEGQITATFASSAKQL